MNLDFYSTSIRNFEFKVDINYEESISLYGLKFWKGIENGSYEQETFDFIEMCARTGTKLFIDIGSATGCMVLFAAANGMQVIGTEPQKLVFEALRKNVELNPLLKDKITILNTLVISKEDSNNREKLAEEKYFTEGASGPLDRSITSNQTELASLLEATKPTEKVALKIDIEGAEYPLLRNSTTLAALKKSSASIFLSFHPGFNHPLQMNPSTLRLYAWRARTLLETTQLLLKILKYSNIYLLGETRKLNTLHVLKLLASKQKDFVLQF